MMAHASIRIYDHGIDRRSEMMSMGRSFPFYVMSYISEGRAFLRVPDRKIELFPGSVIMIPPNVVHDHYMTESIPSTFWWWHFDYKVYDVIDLLRMFELPLVHRVEDTGRFEVLFREYSQAMQLHDSMRNTTHRLACILEVLGNLLEEMTGGQCADGGYSSIPGVFIEMAEMIMYGSGPLDLKFFAEKYNMHPTYISNRFSEIFGVSPIRLYRRMRMQKAQRLLESGEKSVGEVAELLGFSDVSAFSRAFKSYAGHPPSEMKKSAAPTGGIFKSNI